VSLDLPGIELAAPKASITSIPVAPQPSLSLDCYRKRIFFVCAYDVFIACIMSHNKLQQYRPTQSSISPAPPLHAASGCPPSSLQTVSPFPPSIESRRIAESNSTVLSAPVQSSGLQKNSSHGIGSKNKEGVALSDTWKVGGTFASEGKRNEAGRRFGQGSHVCEACKSKKIRCSGERPACSHCQGLEIACFYEERKRGRLKRSEAQVTAREPYTNRGTDDWQL
jgi:hypothetical protein